MGLLERREEILKAKKSGRIIREVALLERVALLGRIRYHSLYEVSGIYVYLFKVLHWNTDLQKRLFNRLRNFQENGGQHLFKKTLFRVMKTIENLTGVSKDIGNLRVPRASSS